MGKWMDCTGAAVLAVALAGCAAAGDGPRLDLLGTPATAAARTIVITPDTRWVNVTGGETVRFVAGAQSFTWNFQTPPTVTSFDLNRIALPGMLDRRIVVYVAINPLYISDS